MEVVDLLDREKLDYRMQGNDLIICCLNPEHEDRNPSLRIDKVTGIFNCFSCGYKGSIFKYFEEEPNYLQQLKNKLSQKIDKVRSSSVGLDIPREAQPYTGNWRGISSTTYEKLGAFTHHSSEFIGRIWFPIKDFAGRIVVFQGRHTEFGTPKYLNYPKKIELPMFMVGKPVHGSVIIVEGIYDLINLYDKGIENAVCIFGVNNMNKDRIALLKLLGVTKVYTFFDGDAAGIGAAEKIGEMFNSADVVVSNISIKDKDPGELTAKQVHGLRKKLYG